jgi:hypothetical protein
MNQKSNQSKEQLESELPTKVLPEERYSPFCKAEIHEVSMKLKKNIDDHIKKQCDAKGADFWDYYLDPRYPEVPDNYERARLYS